MRLLNNLSMAIVHEGIKIRKSVLCEERPIGIVYDYPVVVGMGKDFFPFENFFIEGKCPPCILFCGKVSELSWLRAVPFLPAPLVVSSRVSFCASSAGLRGSSMMQPFLPSLIISAAPLLLVVITGRPQASASKQTLEKGS